MPFEQIFTITISANSVAWYGAIVATLSAIIAILNYLRDRAIIKVKLSYALFGYQGILDDNVNIVIEVINTGRREVTLAGAGFRLSNNNNIIIFDSKLVRFPYELKEGKSISIEADRDGIFLRADENGAKIMFAWVKDATGKIYKAKFKLKREIKDQVKG